MHRSNSEYGVPNYHPLPSPHVTHNTPSSFQHFRGNHGTTLFQKPILQNTYKVQLTFLNHQQFPDE